MLKVNQENIGDKRHLSSIQEYCFDLHHSTYQGPVAQRIRHLTTNQGIPGSNPGRIVSDIHTITEAVKHGKRLQISKTHK